MNMISSMVAVSEPRRTKSVIYKLTFFKVKFNRIVRRYCTA